VAGPDSDEVSRSLDDGTGDVEEGAGAETVGTEVGLPEAAGAEVGLPEGGAGPEEGPVEDVEGPTKEEEPARDEGTPE
jgi:hypothetical protein